MLALLAALEGGLARAADDHDVASAIRRLLAQVEEQSPRNAGTGREYQTLRALYASRDFRPLWGDGLAPSRQATELLQILRTADTYGLRPADYGEGLVPDSLSGSAPDGVGQTQRKAITAAMNGPITLRVTLSKPIRVMILYGTALATEAGTILFFDDIYGHDRKLERLLHLPPAT